MTPVARATLRREIMNIVDRVGVSTDALAGVAAVAASIQTTVTAAGMGTSITSEQEKRISEIICDVVDIEMRTISDGLSAEARLEEYTKLLTG